MNKLFYVPKTCALAPYIALLEAEIPFELVKMSFADGDQRKPEYLKLNPKGRVPLLVTDKGALSEALAILAYVAQIQPSKKLAPTDPFEFAKMQAFNSYLSSTVHVAHAHGRRGIRWADQQSSFDDMKRKVPRTMSECMQLIEDSMFVGPYVMGESYTIADAYLFTICTWLESDLVDIKNYPKLNSHFQMMMKRPAVQKAMESEV